MDSGGPPLHEDGCILCRYEVSLDTDARIRNMRTFRNWNEDVQQPSKGVGPRGDAVQEERLKNFWGNQADIQREAVLDTLS
jgi:hypothetical protein